MIRLEGLGKNYGSSVGVLKDVSLDLAKGEFLYLLGGTGAGKSTLLRLIATEEEPTTGSVSLFGYDLSRVGQSSLQAIRRLIGYVPQDVRLISDLTVFENVALSLSLAGKKVQDRSSRQRILETLERLDLGAKREALGRALSGGEAQRVAVARALVREPALVIADEPTGAQDRDRTWALMDLLVRANVSGATVLVATHDREIVRRVRRRCAVLKGGRIGIEEGIVAPLAAR
jgi:cell division transport system ATP-binding protein